MDLLHAKLVFDDVTNWFQNRSDSIDCEALPNKTVTAAAVLRWVKHICCALRFSHFTLIQTSESELELQLKALKTRHGLRKHLPSSYHGVFLTTVWVLIPPAIMKMEEA